MSFPLTYLNPDLAVAPQLQPEDLAKAAALGFRTIINNRPDGEASDQPGSAAMAEAARAAGLVYHHQPVVMATIVPSDGQRFGELLRQSPGPVLAFCRSGARSTRLWELSRTAG
jgi:sulfide:quinone oxidoreductase